MSNKIPTNILAMYIGQPCTIYCEPGYAPLGIGSAYLADVISASTLILAGSEGHTVTPVLERLDSIAEKDAAHVHILCTGEEFDANQSFYDSARDWLFSFENSINRTTRLVLGKPEAWAYLLSKGYDLFGLIDAGLAKEVLND